MPGNLFFKKDKPSDRFHKSLDRQPCVAGQFYPASAKELKADLKSYFNIAAPPRVGSPIAILAPHAGYIYSGAVAASAFNQIDPHSEFDRIFLIGTSHRVSFDGASVYNQGDYLTPLGKVEVDIDLANKLISEHERFTYNPAADFKEHSLEVQLPFLQYHLQKKFKIVPIIISSQRLHVLEQISSALEPFFNPDNLFVISSDFSHYPKYDDAKRADQIIAEAISTNSPKTFLSAIKKVEQSAIHGLATAMCGWSSMLVLLNISSKDKNIEIIPIEYKNSGDALYGDKKGVVGYWAIAFYQKSKPATFTEQEKEMLIAMAKNSIKEAILGVATEGTTPDFKSEALNAQNGVFVSVYVNGQLRGCLGRFNNTEPLWQAVKQLAVSAATEDSRFDEITAEELDLLSVEISVLTPLQKIKSSKEIQLGKHGIFIKKGTNNGVFLPQVADNYHWTVEEFLGHCARDKAKIGWDGWREAEIYIFEATIFGDLS